MAATQPLLKPIENERFNLAYCSITDHWMAYRIFCFSRTGQHYSCPSCHRRDPDHLQVAHRTQPVKMIKTNPLIASKGFLICNLHNKRIQNVES